MITSAYTFGRHMGIAALVACLATVAFAGRAYGQLPMVDEPPLVFGYFQNSLAYADSDDPDPDNTYFLLQQLNVILQRDWSPDWTAFVNLEFVNTYSSSRMTGAFNLEEVWLRHRFSRQLSIKLGLQIPEFNRLNAIKTKTPLLPYIIRPLAYESSLADVVALDELVPSQAFVSLYGSIPCRAVKFDHAVYVGNSPNINTDRSQGQTGVDTSRTFLLGGRLGARSNDIQVGVSGTIDYVDFLQPVRAFLTDTTTDLREVPRYRLGADARFMAGRFVVEAEAIIVRYDESSPEIHLNKDFYYATVMANISDRCVAYIGFWYLEQEVVAVEERGIAFRGLEHGKYRLRIPTAGAAWTVTDGIVLKAQVGRADQSVDNKAFTVSEFSYYGVAASAMF